jgi:hypothetical protein
MSQRDRTFRETTPSAASTRLSLGEFFAVLFADARRNSLPEADSSRLFHWVVQREGSTEVYQSGQERGLEQARSAAWACLTRLAGRDHRSSNL